MTSFNNKIDHVKCVKHSSISKNNHRLNDDILSKKNKCNLYDQINHKRNERLKAEKLCRKYGIPSKIQSGFHIHNSVFEISFRTLTSKNWYMFMKYITPKIWKGLLQIVHDSHEFAIIFQQYELLLNPFKYDPSKIIYIRKINNSDNPLEKFNYIEFLYENYLFKIPFYNEYYQSNCK